MAKKKGVLDLNLFALICAGVAVACVVFFFACSFYELEVLGKTFGYTFLQSATGVSKKFEAQPIVWLLLALPLAIAAVSLLVNNKFKWIINIALAVVAIVLLFVIPTINLEDLNKVTDITCFDVIGPWVWIKAVCYAGVAGVSIFKLVK